MLAGGDGKMSLMTSVLSGRSSIAWEEPRSLSTMIPDFGAAKAAAGGRSLPVGFGGAAATARGRSTLAPQPANLSEVGEEEEDDEGETTTEQVSWLGTGTNDAVCDA